MPIERVLLTRPKRKSFVLAYQSGLIGNIQYLKELLAQENFILYHGIGPDNLINTVDKTNIKTLKDVLTPNTGNAFLTNNNNKPHLIVTCESFGTVVPDNTSVQVCTTDIQALKSLNIPFVVNALIAGSVTNQQIRDHYNAIKVGWETYKNFVENNPNQGSGIPIPVYPAFVLQQNDLRKYFFNRSLVWSGQEGETRNIFKCGKYTPTMSEAVTGDDFPLEGLIEGEHANRYINGFCNSLVKLPSLGTEIFIKICNDAGEIRSYLPQEISVPKEAGITRFFICPADSFLPHNILDVLNLGNLSLISWIAQDNQEKFSLQNQTPWFNYPWPKQIKMKTAQFHLPLLETFFTSLDYIVCADTKGYSIFQETNIENITWDDVKNSIKISNDFTNNVFPLSRYFTDDNNQVISYAMMEQDQTRLKTSYRDNNSKTVSLKDFFDDIFDPGNQTLVQKFNDVLEVKIDDQNVQLENRRQKLYTAITTHPNKDKFRVHLYSPLVGNIYKVALTGLTLTLTQVPRMSIDGSLCFFSNLCDYSLFNLTQLDPPPGQQEEYATHLEESVTG